ncbi:MAG: leucyl/phenylalanyl-tRNA--protein transferase [Bacteroidota bacterium]
MNFLQTPVTFPNPRTADRNGIVGIGGDLQVATLVQAYTKGIFPWFSESDPMPVWWSPPERMILIPGEEKVSKSMKQVLKKGTVECSFDEAFEAVIRNCAYAERPDQDGTWITEEMIQAYLKLHEAGYAHSIEVWRDDLLIGGLYGVAVGKAFCGESMFSAEPNASKIAFIKLCQWLKDHDFKILDCQNHTAHLESLGAYLVKREDYLTILQTAVSLPGIPGLWSL